uniref:Uncharacterized protein n=1 Tax=Caenorhabditis japonica TaxID=281687 RepID=A0A8R1IXH4_CAEJA
MLKCARMNTPISELTCDRNHLIQEWNHEERVPTANKAYWNIAQKFTELQGIVIKKASEKLVGKKHITLMEYIKLGLFRKQNFIFTSAALIYVGLLIETIFNFLRNRKKFHMNIMPVNASVYRSTFISAREHTISFCATHLA